MDVVELARELVRIPSITNDEGEVCRFVAERLAHEGWVVDTQEIAPELPTSADRLPRLNILARGGPDIVPDVVLTTHLDTVPPHIELTEDELSLHGRGTCDAKGIFAAQWIAANELRAEGYGGVALLAVVGEETDSRGAKAVHKLLPKAGFIVDGEPTELTMASGAKGILSLGLSWQGRAGHSAYPETGHSAVHAMIQALSRLLTAELPYDPSFGPTTVNVGLVDGGLAPNVISPEARASVLIRLGAPKEQILTEVQQILGDEVAIEIRSWSEPHTLLVPEGMNSEVVRFGSDVPYLRNIAPCLLVGPGSIHDAHTSHEYVRKADLYRSVALYKQVAQGLLACR
ncbi:MAG: M20/M25/M40 family metallo-hydrolase [Myxococcales bacterium]|nr:M20/M25/M40 family metallo-hydrolase [Myxococcales bacterium]